MKYDAEQEIILFRNLCQRSFWAYANWAFGIKPYMDRKPENRWMSARVHLPLAAWLDQKAHEWLRDRPTLKRPKKLLVVWPRGFGKTTLVTKAFQSWLHLLDPDISTIIDSVTTEKSWEFLQGIKNVWDGSDPNAWFTQLYGNWRDKDRPWKQGFLVHRMRHSMAAEAASLVCSSVEKGITGKHPDALFIDDPIVQEKLVEGLGWLDKVNRHMDAMIPALKSDGLLVATATRYHDDDWIGRYIRSEGISKVYGMPPPYMDFEVKPTGQWEMYFLQAKKDGKPVLPEVWPQEALDSYEQKNPVEFQAQMMNDPGTGRHMPLKYEQVQRMWVEKRSIPANLRISIHCDTAWKIPETVGRGDYNVIQVWGHASDGSGEVYFLEGHRSNEWTADDFFDVLVMTLKKLKLEGRRAFVITDEQGTGGKAGSFENLLWNHCAQAGIVSPPYIGINRGGRRKEGRIREAAGYWSMGKVWLVREAPGVEPLIMEMLRIGVSAHDDMADAASDVFHPDVYSPETVFGVAEQGPPPRRPYDDILQSPLDTMDDDDVRELYDVDVEREQERAWLIDKWGEA